MVVGSLDRPARLRKRMSTAWHRPGRSPIWVEIIVVVWLLWIYDWVNNLSGIRQHVAVAHASSILAFERRWHLNLELSLNRFLSHHATLALIASDYYDNAHFIVTFGLVGLLWWRYPAVYRPLRNTLVGCNVIGFLVFWLYPVAPPRLVPGAGVVDTVAATHAFGSWHAGTLASEANQLAAMPSLHIAWALWCTLAVWLISRRRLLRVLAVIYPLLTGLAVLSTGNHYVMDVLAGALTTVVSATLAFAWSRRKAARAQMPAPTPGQAWPSAEPAGVLEAG